MVMQFKKIYLSRLARKYLAIQATSAASEWLFSGAGNIMTKTHIYTWFIESLIYLKEMRR